MDPKIVENLPRHLREHSEISGSPIADGLRSRLMIQAAEEIERLRATVEQRPKVSEDGKY